MEMNNWIWASVWVVELGWATRLWQLGIARNYPFLTTYLVFAAAHSSASFLAMRVWVAVGMPVARHPPHRSVRER